MRYGALISLSGLMQNLTMVAVAPTWSMQSANAAEAMMIDPIPLICVINSSSHFGVGRIEGATY
jgi:hypothetical protein